MHIHLTIGRRLIVIIEKDYYAEDIRDQKPTWDGIEKSRRSRLIK